MKGMASLGGSLSNGPMIQTSIQKSNPINVLGSKTPNIVLEDEIETDRLKMKNYSIVQ